ncbi:hypothetical protein ACO0LL_13795 [Undibacterium sp. TC4M20W]|uniref:hypothetical protein n=1 Tax=Undibacterium TaxID=401469 RepID=UPI003BF3413F
MTTSAEELHSQTQAAAKSLEKMTVKEREQRPYSTFASNYNNLLALAKESMPTVDDRRWPPAIEIDVSEGGASVRANYAEIFSYYSQMASILATGIQPLEFGSF